jgi:hypothetical protein
MRNRCGAARRASWQSGRVDQPALVQLEALRPAIKREWDRLLRAEPTLSPLGHPDTLTYMMDETLTQVIKGLGSQSLKSWLRRSPVLLSPLQRQCACGLNPLLTYYATGELALHAAVGSKLPNGVLEALLVVFHVKAQQEIETLCAVCRHRDAPGCARPRVTATTASG